MQYVSCMGLAFVIIGESIRKTGMLTAQQNFSHDIRVEKADEHTLIDHGIYR